MKKYLYIMPAVLVCMLYALLAALAGGVGGFQPIAFVYMGLPLAAGLLLRRGRWWGCLFGIAMGAVLLLKASGAAVAIAAGILLAVYYAAMGILCAAAGRKE